MGGAVTFRVRAVGTPPLSYQWRKEGAPILEATNSTYTLTGVTTNSAGTYNVVVSDGLGRNIQSSTAVLQILAYGAPSIRINGRLAVGTVSVISPAAVTITGGFTDGLMFYTLDGTIPNIGSTLYTGPFSLSNNATLLAMSLSADFTQTSVAPAVTVVVIPRYTLITSVIGSGSIVVSPLLGSYPSNTVVELTASPEIGYAFDHWAGDLTSSTNPATVTMNGPRSVQAVFTRIAYPLTLTTPGGGTVTADGQNIAPNTYYPTGTVVSLAASANSGWSFLRWEGTVSSTSNPLLLAMNQSSYVPAIFGTVVSSVVVGSGTILLNPGNPVAYGTRVTATAVPAPGSSFVVWSGAASGTGNPTTFTATNATPTIGAVFTGPPTPVILIQPTNITVLLGRSAAFTVAASGATPLNYQWRKGTNPIAEATNSTYTIASSVSADAGAYAVVVSNPYGAATSVVAVLTVVIPPSISVQPVNQTVASGGIVTLSVVAAGTEPLRYQWQDGAGAIPSATNAMLVLSPALTNHAGDYTVVVTNPYGTVTSSVATVTVFIPVAITTPPLTQVVGARATATFQVGATGYPAPNYQWLFLGEALPGANVSSLVITNVGTNALGAYRVVVWNAYSSTTSSAAILVMSPSLRFPFVGVTAVWGRDATLSVSAVGSGPLNYQWFRDGAAMPGATNSTLVFPAVQISDGGLYSVVVSSPWGSVTNAPAQLVVNAANMSLGLYAGVTIEGVVGYTYGIQSTTDLRDTNSWVTVTNLTLSEPVQLWVDTSADVHAATNAKRYYRVVGH